MLLCKGYSGEYMWVEYTIACNQNLESQFLIFSSTRFVLGKFLEWKQCKSMSQQTFSKITDEMVTYYYLLGVISVLKVKSLKNILTIEPGMLILITTNAKWVMYISTWMHTIWIDIQNILKSFAYINQYNGNYETLIHVIN